jgi:hypothetical protein
MPPSLLEGERRIVWQRRTVTVATVCSASILDYSQQEESDATNRTRLTAV